MTLPHSRNVVMKVTHIITRTALAIFILTQPISANAAEIRVWTARAIATVLAEIGPEFERTTGHKLKITTDLPTAFARRAQAGEQFDLLISGSSPVDEWIKAGRIIADTRKELARSGIGMGVRAGARKPDISTVEAFKRALLEAKSIAYLRVGSGIYIAGLVDRLGIGDAITPKVTRPESDIVCELVAKGEIELGLVVITQILTTPGVELVGPLPPEIQSYVTFTAGVSANSKQREAARQLIQFLTSPTARKVMKAQGMEPVVFPDAGPDPVTIFIRDHLRKSCTRIYADNTDQKWITLRHSPASDRTVSAPLGKTKAGCCSTGNSRTASEGPLPAAS